MQSNRKQTTPIATRGSAGCHQHAREIRLGIVVAGLLALAGCGQSEPARVAVFGTVQRVGGNLIDAGSVSFLPDEDHRGPAVNTQIVQGRYHFTAETGPTAGKYRVVIAIPRSKAEMLDTIKPAGASDAGDDGAARTQWVRSVMVPKAGSFKNDFTLEE